MSSPDNTSLLARADVRRFVSGQLLAEVGSRITREGLPIVAIVAASATAPLGVGCPDHFVAPLRHDLQQKEHSERGPQM